MSPEIGGLLVLSPIIVLLIIDFVRQMRRINQRHIDQLEKLLSRQRAEIAEIRRARIRWENRPKP